MSADDSFGMTPSLKGEVSSLYNEIKLSRDDTHYLSAVEKAQLLLKQSSICGELVRDMTLQYPFCSSAEDYYNSVFRLFCFGEENRVIQYGIPFCDIKVSHEFLRQTAKIDLRMERIWKTLVVNNVEVDTAFSHQSGLRSIERIKKIEAELMERTWRPDRLLQNGGLSDLEM